MELGIETKVSGLIISRGIIAAWKQEKYASFGEAGYADAARAAVLDMKADIAEALG